MRDCHIAFLIITTSTLAMDFLYVQTFSK